MAKLPIKVIPKSKHRRSIFEGGVLKVWLHAPPIEGRANEELRLYLAKLLEISKSRIEILHGSTSKHKSVDIMGVSVEEIKKSLGK